MISVEEVRAKALELGWEDVGITSASIPEEDIHSYLDWIKEGYHGDLAYMEKQIRCYPQELLPEAKSALLFITYYKQPRHPFRADAGLIASYARGRDYHRVHRKRLKRFITWLEEKSGRSGVARGFSDSTPILEKALAVQAGLGWFGKNSLLIHKKFGTFILLSGILTTLEFPHEVKSTRIPRCGTCQRCLDACPTQAFVAPYHLDASKCLSYHLIESKESLSEEIRKKNPGYAFGCDICQDVCPHNARKPLSICSDFAEDSGIGAYLTLEDISQLEQAPEELHGTPLQRRGVKGLKNTLLR